MPAASLGEVGHSALNAAISKVVRHVAPQTLLLPFVGDIHVDHQLTFLSGLVASRPHQTEFPKFVLAYETVSETNWNAPFLSPAFTPNIFVDISAHLETKLAAIKCYSSQLRSPPHERSLANLQALACVRGATVIREAAEGFVLVRAVL
jgi:LmbE family N-acetylglucosaminyl deacetylase